MKGFGWKYKSNSIKLRDFLMKNENYLKGKLDGIGTELGGGEGFELG
jgi:hypothetical protein